MTTTYFAQGRVIFRFSTDAIDSPRAPAQKVTRAETQIVQYANVIPIPRGLGSVINNVRGRYEKCIVLGNKDFWIRWMSWAS